MLEDGPFTVLDVETTGLFPHCHDRIVEIGMIQINASGSVLGEYESLVNPERDIGPTSIHGITAREAIRAPVFSDIASDIVEFIKDSIIVAHNAQFDLNFLRSDFEKIGHVIPSIPAICTMRLAKKTEPNVGCRKLSALCRHFGVPIQRQHSAMDDARATAGLFVTCLARYREKGGSLNSCFLSVPNDVTSQKTWPRLCRKGKPYPRNRAICEIANESSYIAKLIDRLPVENSSDEIQSYFEMLDRVLADRRVTLEEQDDLYTLAMYLGLSKDSVINAHREYLKELVKIALEDEVITEAENKDIDDVRHLLAISDDEFCEIIDEIEKGVSSSSYGKARIAQIEFIGKTVCFTGELRSSYHGQTVSREVAKHLASSKGMIVSSSVTRKLDFLVCADPDSMSGKAKKARQYGICILAEPVYWNMLGIDVD